MMTVTKGLIFVVIASMVIASQAAETIDVGGSEGWHTGYNYSDWALKHGPFFKDDILVFKYGPPSTNTQAHNVYLLPNVGSYLSCDFTGAELLGSESQGDGNGFQYKLTSQWRPLFFASNGTTGDCEDGLMKFVAVPLPRWEG